MRFIKAFLAGLFLAFGGALVQVMNNSPELVQFSPGLLKIIQGAVFPVGLVMIVLFQADLVTASQAIFILATLKRKVPIHAFLIDWTICTIGNLAGALLFGGFVAGSEILAASPAAGTPTFAAQAAALANTKMAPGFGQILLRGIGCNMLVCIAVFQASLMKDGISKIAASWFPISVFIALGFDHVVANFFVLLSALMYHSTTNYSVGTYIWKSLISSFIGNFVGAAIIALPLLACHGGNEFDPSKLSKSTAIAPSPEGTVAHEKTQQWAKDVEHSAVVP